MKKLLLSGLALTIGLSVIAQDNHRQVQSKLSESTKSIMLPLTKPTDGPLAPVQKINPTVSSSRASMVETVIGQTTYDLQSNYGSVGNRVKLWDDNTISAVWTRGMTDPGFSDRGTGYNYYDGSSWGPAPTARIETFRTGWPNVSGTGSGAEYVVNHGTNPTNIINRGTKGTGAWTESVLGTTTFTWPRMVVGGANGQSVHVIGNENAGGFYMKYSRSTDGGATWVDENVVLPDFTNIHYEGTVDAYDLDARGDVIAIVMGGFNEGLTLWKSLDNGATWTSTVINAFPLAPWDYTASISDVNGDGIADTIPTTDSGMSVVLDNNNVAHVAVGSTRVLCTATPDVSYFPGTDGLLYWNETMPPGNILNNVIAEIEDIDGSGMIELAPAIAIYQCGLTGMPSLGVDAQNNIHLTYSSVIENTTNGNANPADEQSFRNVYYMYSTDMGANWSTPTRIEPSDFDEMVWPNMSKRVNNCINVVYHKDGEPGNTFQTSTGATADPYAPYDVIYTCITNPVGLNEVNDNVASISVFPNPATTILNIDYSLVKGQSTTVQLVDVLGKVVYNTTYNAATGMNNLKINVKDLASGMYSLNISNGSRIASQKVIVQ
jgi:hypothetical protein